MKKVYIVYFSPTKTTRTIVRKIAEGTEIEDIVELDITLPKNRLKKNNEINDDSLIIFGMPVYGGRIPKLAAEYLKTFRGNNQPTVTVVVYGNRDYDDALLETADIVKERGFNIIAAGAFIGEHSFADENHNIANNRPDNKDKRKAVTFGKIISSKIDSNDLSKPNIPGKRPYKAYGKPLRISPVKGKECTNCMICKDICPVHAINEKGIADKNKCISCCACIKSCPENARSVKSPIFKPIVMMLSKCKKKEPQTFI